MKNTKTNTTNTINENTINEIMLVKKEQLIVPIETGEKSPLLYAMTFNKNIEALGFCLSKEVIDAIANCSIKTVCELYKIVLKILKEMVGADVQYTPMYKNFPNSVMEASEAELLYNQFFGYLIDSVDRDRKATVATRKAISVDGKKLDRAPVDVEKTGLKTISIGNVTDFYNFVKNLIGGNSSITEDDKKIISWAIINCPEDKILPDEIIQKEILGFTAAELVKNNKSAVSFPAKTATDVLRIASAFSDGDVSLSSNCKFKLKNKERRFIMQLLDIVAKKNFSQAYEDMTRNTGRFVRLAEVIHPSDFKQFGDACKLFSQLRENIKQERFIGRVNKALQAEDVLAAIALLKTRPGEFARALDKVLRSTSNNIQQDVIVDVFASIAEKVNPSILLSLVSHFSERYGKQANERIAFPKGNAARVIVWDNTLKPFSENLCKKVIGACNNGIIKQFSKKEKMGKVFISKELKSYTVPFGVRSQQKAFRTVSRGSRIKIADATKVLRSFIYWVGEDLDLSAVFMDEEFNCIEHVSYTNLRSGYSENCIAAHSGDVTYAPTGDSEFIDINLEKLEEKARDYKNYRYVAFNVYCFTTGLTFSSLPKCYFGMMERKSLGSGEIYEPTTVKTKYDLTRNCRNCIPMLYDIERREMIWVDMELNGQGYNVECSENATSLACKAIVDMAKPNLYDLFMLNAKARNAVLVETPEEAETVFSVYDGVTPFDRDVIVSDYM